MKRFSSIYVTYRISSVIVTSYRESIKNIFLFKRLLRFSRLNNEKDPGRVKRNGTEGVTTYHGLLHEPTNWK